MHSTESRSSGHSDTNLETLPVKSVLLSATKRLLIRLYDENSDKMFALSYSDEEGVSHSQSVDPDESRTATLYVKLEGAIEKDTECIPKTAQTSRAISRNIAKDLDIFIATGKKTANKTQITAVLDSIPPTSVEAERSFSAIGLFITRLRTRLSVNCLSFLHVYFKSK